MVSTATVLPLNWIHSKIISGAAFRIIGLPKIEFLPLDWIYHSIRINTVLSNCAYYPGAKPERSMRLISMGLISNTCLIASCAY